MSSPSTSTPVTAPAPAKRENMLLNIVFNIAIPAVIMGQLSKEDRLGPAWGLIVALLFPLGYGIYDFVERKKANFISILGFAGVLLSGVLGLMKLDGRWFAVKDAAIPALIAVVLLISLKSREPLVKSLLYNDQVMDVDRIAAVLKARNGEAALLALLRQCTLIVAISFLVSAVLNYWLARYLLKSPGGTAAFNEELAKMHWLSWPVIVVPSMLMMMLAMWRLVSGLKALTGLTTDELFRAEEKAKKTTD